MSLLGRELQSGLWRREELCEGDLENGIGKHVTHKTPMVVYYDVRARSIKDVPPCDVFVTGPPCRTFSSLGKRKGALASQGRLLFHSCAIYCGQVSLGGDH